MKCVYARTRSGVRVVDLGNCWDLLFPALLIGLFVLVVGLSFLVPVGY